MKSRSASILSLLLAAALLTGCCPLCKNATPSPTAVLKAADAALPKVEFSGFGEFAGGRLFDYMNGAAEGYYQFNFRVLAAADAKQGECEAKVEVYRLADPADAKSLFDGSNDGKGKPLPEGVAGTCWYARELEGIFHRGPFFCRILVYGDDDKSKTFLNTLATHLDQAIPQ